MCKCIDDRDLSMINVKQRCRDGIPTSPSFDFFHIYSHEWPVQKALIRSMFSNCELCWKEAHKWGMNGKGMGETVPIVLHFCFVPASVNTLYVKSKGMFLLRVAYMELCKCSKATKMLAILPMVCNPCWALILCILSQQSQ